MALNLVKKRLVTDQLVVGIGYDVESLTRPDIRANYDGEIVADYYGRKVPKSAHGSGNLSGPSSSMREITDAVLDIYDRIVNPQLLIRRLTLVSNHVVREEDMAVKNSPVQLDLFTDYEAKAREKAKRQEQLDKERRLQEARLKIRERFGKNAILRGLNFEEGATARDRNKQIGGHKA